MSKLRVVGIGPGSRDYLTLKAIEVVESADIMVGSKRSLKIFSNLSKEQIVMDANNVAETLKLSVIKVEEGKDVAILSTGDPGFSGILKPLQKFAKHVEIEVIPGISSIQLCAAKLQIPWEQADLISLHGKNISDDFLDILDNRNPTFILPQHLPNETAKFLLNRGLDPQRKVVVCEKLSYPDEKITRDTLKRISELSFDYMSVMVIL